MTSEDIKHQLIITNAEARFNKSLRPRKPEGSLGRTAQDVHLDSHTAPELSHSSWTLTQLLNSHTAPELSHSSWTLTQLLNSHTAPELSHSSWTMGRASAVPLLIEQVGLTPLLSRPVKYFRSETCPKTRLQTVYFPALEQLHFQYCVFWLYSFHKLMRKRREKAFSNFVLLLVVLHFYWTFCTFIGRFQVTSLAVKGSTQFVVRQPVR